MCRFNIVKKNKFSEKANPETLKFKVDLIHSPHLASMIGAPLDVSGDQKPLL